MSFPIANQAIETDRDVLAAEYFESLPFEPYPVQEEALLAYFTSQQGVLVCAPTGTGKTLIAEAAVYEALRSGTRMYYTTPLIALTDQKLDELRESAQRWGFSADQIGLVTGNRSVNPDAPVLVVVAEILMNRLLNPESFDFANVSSVVMDEFHSFNDVERGIVWELSLGLLPSHVRTLLLSATVGNSVEFTSWLSRAHQRRLQLVQGTERKVPLQYEWIDDEILPDFMESISAGDSEKRRTPALLFCFNRSQCWQVAELLKGKGLCDKAQKAELADYLNATNFRDGVGPKLKSILMRGVGVHHAGVLPRYRRIVESLFQRKLLSACVCTETLAAGINLPARSVILPNLLKGPPDKKKVVEVSSAHQIFGRAGRPQFDDRGFVYVLAHEDDVKIKRWREKLNQIPEDTKDPGLLKMRKQLKKKMPKRRTGEQYWTEAQFEKLREAPSANLASRGQLPWRLLAYILETSAEVQPLRDLVGRRLLAPQKIEEAQRDLNRMLVTLWVNDYIKLVPPPSRNQGDPGKPETASKTDAVENQPSGLFGHLLTHSVNTTDERSEGSQSQSAQNDPSAQADPSAVSDPKIYQLDQYHPQQAHPTPKLELLVRLKSINPIYGVYLADQLAIADPAERILALESVLDVPGTVARLARVPKYEDMPAGTLATSKLDPLLLQRGLATAEELGSPSDDEEEDVQNRGFGRVMFDEPKVWPLTLGEKIYRLFQSDCPGVHDVRIRPVWIVGRLMEFDGNFNNYITGSGLQKEEGIIFRHLLRMVLLLDEMANIPPLETPPEQWEDPLDQLADRLTEICREVDPQSTEEALTAEKDDDGIVTQGRRTPKPAGCNASE